MQNRNVCLGLCFFDNQLFYAVSSPEQRTHLDRVGAVDFNFDVAEAILSADEHRLKGLCKTVVDLKTHFDVHQLRLLSHPSMECWTILPRLVYENATEREAHIDILMRGIERNQIHPTWHRLSNENYKLLQLRTDQSLQGIRLLTTDFANVDFLSAFEVGDHWIAHARPGGSLLTICCFKGCISVSSYILGKLRGATFIEFDHPEDLPYLWLRQAQELPWMQGLHEQIQVYGHQAYQIIDTLQAFWDDAGTITKMDTLQKIQVEADEHTYSFDLEAAYPAIMLACAPEVGEVQS